MDPFIILHTNILQEVCCATYRKHVEEAHAYITQNNQ